MQYISVVRYGTVRYGTVHYSIVRYNTVQFTAVASSAAILQPLPLEKERGGIEREKDKEGIEDRDR